MNQSDLRMPDANKKASELLNRWMSSIRPQVEESGFLKNKLIQLAIAKLGFAVVAELEAAYSDGWNAAVAAQQAEREQGY